MTLELKVRVSTSSRIDSALAPGEERDTTADQHRVDDGPVLVDQIQTRPPRRRASRRRSRCRPPLARLAAARSPPPGRRRPGGRGPRPSSGSWRTPPSGAASRARPTRARRRRAIDPGWRSPSTASSRTVAVPSGARRPLGSRRSRSERPPRRAPSSRSGRPAPRCSRQGRRPSNRSRCASGVLLGHGFGGGVAVALASRPDGRPLLGRSLICEPRRGPPLGVSPNPGDRSSNAMGRRTRSTVRAVGLLRAVLRPSIVRRGRGSGSAMDAPAPDRPHS